MRRPVSRRAVVLCSVSALTPIVFAQLGLDPNTTSLLATGVYGITNTVFTLPAVFFLDNVGRRPLLMMGAAGCFVSLVVVGSMVAAFSPNWTEHVAAGRVAIGAQTSLGP